MTHSNRSAILLLLACFLLTAGWLGCKSPAPNDPTTRDPTLGTTSVSDVKTTTAKVSSSITDVGFGPLNTSTIKEYGICYGTKDKPTTADQKVTLGTSATAVLTMVAPLAGLAPGTTYYVRGYVVYDGGTVYGDQAQFITDNMKAPELTIADAADLSTTAFSITGRITALGTSDVTQYGHVLSATNQTPTTADTKTEMGTTNAAPKDFKSVFSSLTANTTYYVRAYAINASGTGYSEVKTVKTANLQPPTVTTDNITNVSAAGAGVGMTIVSIGTNNNIKAGVCWSSTNQTPTVNDAKTANGTSAAQFFSNDLTGLSPNTTYYVRAYATNNDGIGYGAVKSFKTLDIQLPVVTAPTNPSGLVGVTGFNPYFSVSYSGSIPITEVGLCYSTSNQAPTVGDSKVVSSRTNTGSYQQETLSKLQPNTTYYVRAYAVTSAGIGYSPTTTVKTLALVAPTLQIYPTGTNNFKLITVSSGPLAIKLTTLEFTSSSTITEGNTTIIAFGTCYSSTNQTPTINDTRTTYTDRTLISPAGKLLSDKISQAGVSTPISGVTPSPIYVRVYAQTDQGVYYSTVEKYTY